MTPRQRWLCILEDRTPDRIPTDYWSTPEFNAKLVAASGCEGDAMFRKLGIDRPRFIGPKQLRHHHPNDSEADLWGLRHSSIDYGSGAYDEVAHHPLAHVTSVSEIESYRWPDAADDFDYTSVTEAVDTDDDYRIRQAGGYEPFLLYCALRGMEQAFEDMVLEPAIAEAALSHIFNFYHEHNRRIWNAGKGKIDIMYLAEDLAGQSGPLFSLAMYRRFLLPGQTKMAELARSFGIHVFYHTDGAAKTFIPDLIDVVGINILNPLQWRCPGMELQGLVREFGKHIAFHGGIDNQQTLPFGTVEDVRKEVRDVAAIMEGARWICAPCHNIQAVGPAENVMAMYDEAAKLKPTGSGKPKASV